MTLGPEPFGHFTYGVTVWRSAISTSIGTTVPGTTVILYRSATVPLYQVPLWYWYCTTVTLILCHRTTVLLYHCYCTTVLLYRWHWYCATVTLILYHSANNTTVILCHFATVPLWYWTTVILYHFATVLLYPCATIPLCYRTTVLLYHC
jgi:hypothetical protein